MSDFNYTSNGLFVSLLPNNDQAQECHNQIWNELGGKIPVRMWASIRSQLRKAGYSITKAKPVSKKEIDDVLNNDTLRVL